MPESKGMKQRPHENMKDVSKQGRPTPPQAISIRREAQMSRGFPPAGKYEPTRWFGNQDIRQMLNL